MTREEMIADVIRSLKEIKVTSVPSKVKVERDFGWLERKNYSKLGPAILSLDVGLNYEDVIKYLGSFGLLKVTPKVTWVDNLAGVPYFQIRRNAFISWFNHTNFRVVRTPGEEGIVFESDTTLWSDLLVAETLPIDIRPAIVLSHVAQAANSYNEFWPAINTDEELIDEFILTTQAEQNIQCETFKFKNFKSQIKKVKELPKDSVEYVVFLDEVSSNKYTTEKSFAMLAYAENYVALKHFKDENWTVLFFPKHEELVFEDSRKAEEIVKGFYLEVLWLRLTWLLFMIEGIFCNESYIYPRKKKDAVYIDTKALVQLDDIFSVNQYDELSRLIYTLVRDHIG